jgi:hypothetical protein
MVVIYKITHVAGVRSNEVHVMVTTLRNIMMIDQPVTRIVFLFWRMHDMLFMHEDVNELNRRSSPEIADQQKQGEHLPDALLLSH